jgi:hypothetical protein
MHNIIDSSITINDIERRNIKEFEFKQRSGWSYYHLTYYDGWKHSLLQKWGAIY